ncbi:MAG: trypsin, partial [Armatimonadetes bacterium]|nr:trypsin [Armatimonadota bacterium]
MTTQTPLPRLEVDEVLRGLGVLSVSREDQKIALPLAGVDLQARVADRVADVEMTQVFRNPHQEALEATYVFPLPGGAAVRALELKVGGRTLVGKV